MVVSSRWLSVINTVNNKVLNSINNHFINRNFNIKQNNRDYYFSIFVQPYHIVFIHRFTIELIKWCLKNFGGLALSLLSSCQKEIDILCYPWLGMTNQTCFMRCTERKCSFLYRFNTSLSLTHTHMHSARANPEVHPWGG